MRQGWAVAPPAEYLLTTGGDTRLRLDPETGLNRYGCSPRPRPEAITFASTTATSISVGAFRQVESLRQSLLQAAIVGQLSQAYTRAMEDTRSEILALSGAAAVPGCQAVLTPSGTDAEFYALELALAGHDRPLTNIVIAPHETGSSVVPAASGRNYNTITALGVGVEIDAPVDETSAARVEINSVPVRDAAGELLPVAEVDATAEQFAAAAVKAGRRVLLHLLDTSKTGMVAPSVACVVALARRFAGHLDVIVDASQLRMCPETIAAYLGQGFMVILTGSKFFTGPPFAGALLVPPGIGLRVVGDEACLPAGYSAYTTRACWPAPWAAYCRNLNDSLTLGVLLRWWAALWEMRAFHAITVPGPRLILDTFIRVIGEAVDLSPVLRRLPVPVPDRSPLIGGQGWDGLPTILPFALVPEGASAPLDLAMAQRLYGWLNRDVSAWLPAMARDEERRLASLRCHIGQPVLLGETLCGLRLAAGARLVSDGPALLEQEIADARRVLAKIAFLLRHLEHFAASIG
ncbi:MAG: hypothetical protein HQL37_11460 [Alphaproteobacteria bacterium]|nr:hypothetical protein [Alphaproteobacteria bacterium]